MIIAIERPGRVPARMLRDPPGGMRSMTSSRTLGTSRRGRIDSPPTAIVARRHRCPMRPVTVTGWKSVRADRALRRGETGMSQVPRDRSGTSAHRRPVPDVARTGLNMASSRAVTERKTVAAGWLASMRTDRLPSAASPRQHSTCRRSSSIGSSDLRPAMTPGGASRITIASGSGSSRPSHAARRTRPSSR